MSWDAVWDDVFGTRPWGKYPPEELIRFVARRFYSAPDRSAVRILELGCGPGANVWYLAREGFDVTGIDGSEPALDDARGRLDADQLQARLLQGDFTDLSAYVGPQTFDAVVDVCGLQHNRIGAVANAVKAAYDALVPSGSFFAMLVAAGSWGDGLGTPLEEGTYTDISAGPLAGMGVSHFFSLEEVRALLTPFEDVQIEYSERSLEDRAHTYRHWVVAATRPA